ncbi:flagellar biosynthesis anti-sigma factor FlgM [Aurantiacibacter luteus]|uniref:flagellar biosynthesis anti-sigma factor FlgM n=1 Tax=Aurantiacibacter luteus TaxID=1581420 RepID=UPI00069AB60D|nr:flagellar biosynthesis anti-sigma factor FlgM [Aurantiacibacter luteus]
MGARAEGRANALAGAVGKAPARIDGGVEVETGQGARADAAPIDAERVGEIRNALRDGTYPILPARIADAMIAARLMLSSPE